MKETRTQSERVKIHATGKSDLIQNSVDLNKPKHCSMTLHDLMSSCGGKEQQYM